VKAPRPNAIRLYTFVRDVKAPRPPFGLAHWSDDARALAVWLEAGKAEDLAAIAAQIPQADTLAANVPVAILGTAVRRRGAWGRVFGLGTVIVSTPVRCTALLVRGYVDIGAEPTLHHGTWVVWGWSPEGERAL
jgi:hypothetical protein